MNKMNLERPSAIAAREAIELLNKDWLVIKVMAESQKNKSVLEALSKKFNKIANLIEVSVDNLDFSYSQLDFENVKKSLEILTLVNENLGESKWLKSLSKKILENDDSYELPENLSL